MELSTSLKVKQVRNVVLGIALILMVGACGGATSSDNPSPRFQVESQQNVAYGPLSDEKLDLCQPIGSAGTRPGILLIHAGGWTQGDKSSFDTLCNRFASQGFVAAAINYRLANSSSPSTQWPAQLVDVQLAVRYLRSRADQLNLDTKRLCAFGTSAGGQLAIFLGVLKKVHQGDQANLLTDQSTSVSCVVDEFGPVDLTKIKELPNQISSSLFGGATYQSNPQIYRDASPIFDVTSQSVPMLIIQGTQDTTVPVSQSLELKDALQRNHVSVQYITYRGGHSFAGLNRQQISALEAQIFSYLITQEHP